MALRRAVIRIGQELYRNIVSYSVVEDSTPIDPADTSGGFGQITAVLPRRHNWRSLRKLQLDLRDRGQGVTTGKTTAISESKSGKSVTISADSRIGGLTVRRTAKPFVGTLAGAIRYYLGLVDITTGIIIDESLESIPVVFPGWEDEVYQKVAKQLMPSMQIEMSLISNNIVFRPLRGRVAENYRDTDAGETIDDSEPARAVIGHYYSPEYRSNYLAYPDGGWNDQVEVFIVESGETKVIEDIPITASLDSIQQPTVVQNVTRAYDSSSVYAVAGDDGLPIVPKQWTDNGGKLTVEINEDTQSLKVTIVGATIPNLAPFRIAVSSGPSDYYSSLRLVGTGVFIDDQQVKFDTGRTEDDAPTEVGADVENPFIRTLGQLYDIMVWSVGRFTGPRQSINVSSDGINRRGNSGVYRYATIDEFNTANAGLSIAQFNAQWSGRTIAEFNAFWDEQVSNSFANQAFGNVAGARVPYVDQMYRIRTATNSSSGITYTAERDSLVGDFNLIWAGATLFDFNKAWEGYTLKDFNTSSLSKAPRGLKQITSYYSLEDPLGSGLYRTNATVQDITRLYAPAEKGLYIEDPVGSGLYIFTGAPDA